MSKRTSEDLFKELFGNRLDCTGIATGKRHKIPTTRERERANVSISLPTLSGKTTPLYVMRMDSNTCPFVPILETFKNYGCGRTPPQSISAKLHNMFSSVCNITVEKNAVRPYLYIPCASELPATIPFGVRDAVTLTVRNNCATSTRKIMEVGSYVFGLTSVAKVGLRPSEFRDIIYVALVDRITGDGEAREGIAKKFWYFGAANPLQIADAGIRDGVKERFRGQSSRNNGNASGFKWTEDALVRWFLRQNISPGIHGVPRQRLWGPHSNDVATWLHYDLCVNVQFKYKAFSGTGYKLC